MIVSQPQPSAGWFDVSDVLFTSLPLVTATGNGALVNSGWTYNVQNFANASVMSVGGADGWRVKANTVNSTNTPPSRTGPCISTPSFGAMSSRLAGNRFALRVSVWLGAYTFTQDGATFDFYVDTGNNNQRTELSQYRKSAGAGVIHYARLVLGNTVMTTKDVVDPYCPGQGGTADCFQMEIPFYGSDFSILRVGNYAGGWPASWFNIGQDSAAAGTWLPAQMTTSAQGFVTMGVESLGNAGTAEAKVYRMRIEAKL